MKKNIILSLCVVAFAQVDVQASLLTTLTSTPPKEPVVQTAFKGSAEDTAQAHNHAIAAFSAHQKAAADAKASQKHVDQLGLEVTKRQKALTQTQEQSSQAKADLQVAKQRHKTAQKHAKVVSKQATVAQTHAQQAQVATKLEKIAQSKNAAEKASKKAADHKLEVMSQTIQK